MEARWGSDMQSFSVETLTPNALEICSCVYLILWNSIISCSLALFIQLTQLRQDYFGRTIASISSSTSSSITDMNFVMLNWLRRMRVLATNR